MICVLGFQQFGGRSRAHQAQAQRQQQYYRQQQQAQQQAQQRRRQAAAGGGGSDLASGLGGFIQLLPLIILILVSISSGLFSGSSSSSHGSNPINAFSLRPREQFTAARHTTIRKVPYYVNEDQFMRTYFPGQNFEWTATPRHQIVVKPDHVTLQGQKVGPLFKRMEEQVELSYLREMQVKCRDEKRKKEVMHNKAMGFWGADRKLWTEAQKMPMPSCDIVKEKYGKEYVR